MNIGYMSLDTPQNLLLVGSPEGSVQDITGIYAWLIIDKYLAGVIQEDLVKTIYASFMHYILLTNFTLK